MIWSISWKNVWRNKTRSMVVIVAMAIGLFGGVYAISLMNGIMSRRTNDVINIETSHIQAHNPEFSFNNEQKFVIADAGSIAQEISALPEVKAVSRRIKIESIVRTANASTGVMINGVFPEQEKQVTSIHEKLMPKGGKYFNGKENGAVISTKIATKLKLTEYRITQKSLDSLKKLDVGEEIIANLDTLSGKKYRVEKKFINALKETIGEKNTTKYKRAIINASVKYKLRRSIFVTLLDKDGHTVEEAFKVVGIYKTSNAMFDEFNMFVRHDFLNNQIGFAPEASHEIAILLNETEQSETLSNSLKDRFPDLEFMQWKEIQPDQAMYAEYMDIYNYIFILIILFALAFGIINTMLMVVLERVKELGMLMAVGMNKGRVFSMIMLETVFLSITGAASGLLFSYIMVILTKDGIDLQMYAEGFEAIGYSAIMYPEIDWSFYISVTFLVILTGIISSIYPAIKALKLNPSEAIRVDV